MNHAETEIMNKPPILALTMGDPAGVGPEIILKAYTRFLPRHIPIVFGDPEILQMTAKTLSLSPKIRTLEKVRAPLLTNREGLNLLRITELPLDLVRPGHVDAFTGKASGRYIEAAIEAALKNEVDAVVTCPIHKRAFHLGGYPFPGHTEMFAEHTKSHPYAMMMVSSPLKVALATIHLPLREIFDHLTPTRIRETILLTHRALKTWFGIPSPRIAVLALNPHGGEGGDLGDEENGLITPVIRELEAEGLHLTGPLPPDTAFTRLQRKRHDAFVAMYHDQGLIPFKLLAFETGINLTLGLPFPRVSVDHGTGLDIAGKGIASAASLRAAIRWAIRFSRPHVLRC